MGGRGVERLDEAWRVFEFWGVASVVHRLTGCYGAVNQSDGKVEKSHSPLSSNSSPAETLKLEAGQTPPHQSGHRGQPQSLPNWQADCKRNRT